MNRNFVWLMLVTILASSLSFTGCKKGSEPTDVMESARRSLSVGDLERCAKEEFAEARRLLADAEQAVKDKRYDRAEELAREAAAQAQHARRVAEANPECQPKPPEPVDPAGTTSTDGASAHEFTTIHFNFDSAELSGSARRTLEGHGRELRDKPNMRIRVEGHCSEEGTPEYNLALGNRRARAVREFLVNYGIDGSRIDTISYGEERPAGRGEQNRRAEFTIR